MKGITIVVFSLYSSDNVFIISSYLPALAVVGFYLNI